MSVLHHVLYLQPIIYLHKATNPTAHSHLEFDQTRYYNVQFRGQLHGLYAC